MPGPLAALAPLLISAVTEAIKGPGVPTNPVAGGVGINMQPTQEEDAGSVINADIARADGQPQAPLFGAGGEAAAAQNLGVPLDPPVVDAGGPPPITQPGTPLPEPTAETAAAAPGKMSMEAKMAIAAQMGSLLRGPGPPRPPSAPSGPGIQMQPTTLDDIYGRR